MERRVDRYLEMPSLGGVVLIRLGQAHDNLFHIRLGFLHKGNSTNLDPVMHLNILVCGIKVKSCRSFFLTH